MDPNLLLPSDETLIYLITNPVEGCAKKSQEIIYFLILELMELQDQKE